MNFVDSQPRSFLDYAWTSPSTEAINATKPSKTSRRQNRCCDQCRKGKRACDAAILEDTLLDANKLGGSPTVFHYSDNFGALAPCGNCEKTKKNCTFEWLRSQRVLQASQQPPRTAPLAKRRRTQGSLTTTPQEAFKSNFRDYPVKERIATPATSVELGVTFGDFPCAVTAFDTDPSTSMFQPDSSFFWQGSNSDLKVGSAQQNNVLGYGDTVFDCDSGQGSSLRTLSESDDRTASESPNTSESTAVTVLTIPVKPNGNIMRSNRKRRRRSSSATMSNGAPPCPAISIANGPLSSTNNAYITEGLLRIYHNSFENALSCWLTERTCPYSTRTEVSLAGSATPDWNRIYYRVARLDRLAASIRGRQLTFTEDKAASRSLDLAVYAFASQWAQSSQRSKTKYPFQSDGSNSEKVLEGKEDENETSGMEFDRALQTSTWYEARNALQNAGEIESFRVVLAQIVFALTQKPMEDNDARRWCMEEVAQTQTADSEAAERDGTEDSESPNDKESDVDECEDLMSRLNLAIDIEGPPVHLEKGLRLIHSLRSKMAMLGEKPRKSPGLSHCAKRYRSASRIDNADRATVDLLFWLGVMFDTLSAAMHKRPLVVSDEDSNIYPSESDQAMDLSDDGKEVVLMPSTNGLWDKYLFAHQRGRLEASVTRWPCTFDQAAALLCDAAPVKVLLFRKVTRIQTLLARDGRNGLIDQSIEAALDVCNHWKKLYAPFIQDCVKNHDRLHARIQSWYICLAGHWHLATLLLADLIEIVDESERGSEEARVQRNASNFVAHFRESNCRTLSDLAKCACPRDEATFTQSRDFHSALNAGALLTEPWTAVLIRAFAKAGVVLLELNSESETIPPCSVSSDEVDVFQRADDCVKALWFLGRKSDMALSAAKVLGAALKQRRKSLQDKVNDISVFLEAELWHGLDGFDEAFGVDCE